MTMTITEVRIKPVGTGTGKLRAFATFVINGAFAVRDVKVVETDRGLIVAMPSRRVSDRCPYCGGKNAVAQRYCGDCGARLADGRVEGLPRLYMDVAHPIDEGTRRIVTEAVLGAYRETCPAVPMTPLGGRLAKIRA